MTLRSTFDLEKQKDIIYNPQELMRNPTNLKENSSEAWPEGPEERTETEWERERERDTEIDRMPSR